jgi:hypothetical protein
MDSNQNLVKKTVDHIKLVRSQSTPSTPQEKEGINNGQDVSIVLRVAFGREDLANQPKRPGTIRGIHRLCEILDKLDLQIPEIAFRRLQQWEA